MKKNEIQLLLVVLGILFGFLSWQFVYKNYMAKTEQVEAENVDIKARLDQLELLNARQQEYVAETERMKEESTQIENTFPPGYRNEDIIMYLYNMEMIDDNEVRISTIDMQEPVEITYPSILDVEGYTLQDDGLQMYTNSNTLTFTTTYSGLKNVINYIYGISTRKSVASVNVSATEDGYLAGSIDMNFYCLLGTEFPYVNTKIPGVPTGTSNFFGVRQGSLADIVPEGEEGAEGEDAAAGAEAGADAANNAAGNAAAANNAAAGNNAANAAGTANAAGGNAAGGANNTVR